MTAQNNGQHPEEAALSELAIKLRPFGATSAPESIDVEIVASRLLVPVGTAAFLIPIRVASLASCDIPAESVAAFDESGPLGITAVDDEPDASGFLYFRRYFFNRETKGLVRLRYRVKGCAVGSRSKSGPPFDLLYENGGISGAGATFLVLPAGDADWKATIKWDLVALQTGASAVSSFGDGDAEFVGKAEKLHFAFYMAGKMRSVVNTTSDSNTLNAYWLGEPRFDVQAAFEWVAKLYRSASQMLPNRATKPFLIMGRAGSIPKSGGAALQQSFMIGFGTEPEAEIRIKFLLAHELAHPLAGDLGKDGLEHSWYAEGLAEFYKLMAPLRSGLVTDSEFLVEFSRSTREYYANRLINLPSSRIRERFWSDSQAQRLPYARGLLYFVSLDQRVREASQGKRSLDDLVNQMFHNAQAGKDRDLAMWRDLVVKELGEVEAQLLDAMIDGLTLVPNANAFGDRFVRREIEMRVVDVGFDEASFGARKVIGLNEESPAFDAGLREGDLILSHNYSFDRLALEGGFIRVCVSRGDGAHEAVYAPEGHSVSGYEWHAKE